MPILINVEVSLKDPEILPILLRMESLLNAIAAEILPGPAVALDLVPGPITEQQE